MIRWRITCQCDRPSSEQCFLSTPSSESLTLQQEKLREQERLKEVAQWVSKVASEAEWGFAAGGAKEKVYIGIGFIIYLLFTVLFCSPRLIQGKWHSGSLPWLPWQDRRMWRYLQFLEAIGVQTFCQCACEVTQNCLRISLFSTIFLQNASVCRTFPSTLSRRISSWYFNYAGDEEPWFEYVETELFSSRRQFRLH